MNYLRPLQAALIYLVTLLIFPDFAQAELPELGDPTRQELTPQREAKMGKDFYLTLKANIPFILDLEVNDYINTLGQKLITHSSNPQGHYKFFVVHVPSINAFAGPHGYIGFHTGLIIEAQNESEFAGVMAHEISHVTQRHLARRMTDNNASPAAFFATILAGILVASQSPDAGAALIYGGQAALIQSSINFTRANEHEADRIGINVLRQAGINPQGMAGFFRTLLEQASTDNTFARMEYLRTHPLNSTRVAEASNRISNNDLKLPDDSLDFQLTRARLVVTTSQSIDALIKRIKKLGASQRNLLSEYTLGIALLKNHQAAEAIQTLRPLSQKQRHPWLKLALADALIANRNDEEALKLLQQLNALYPDYLPCSIRLAKLQIDLQHPQEAILLLNQQLRTQRQPVVYNTLAKAYFANGQISLAMEATSYEYELEGHLKLAIQQINNALQQPKLNKHTIQRLESRQQELSEQIKIERKF